MTLGVSVGFHSLGMFHPLSWIDENIPSDYAKTRFESLTRCCFRSIVRECSTHRADSFLISKYSCKIQKHTMYFFAVSLSNGFIWTTWTFDIISASATTFKFVTPLLYCCIQWRRCRVVFFPIEKQCLIRIRNLLKSILFQATKVAVKCPIHDETCHVN